MHILTVRTAKCVIEQLENPKNVKIRLKIDKYHLQTNMTTKYNIEYKKVYTTNFHMQFILKLFHN